MQGVKYDHLKFFNNSASNGAALPSGLVLGGVSVVPGLKMEPTLDKAASSDCRSATQKHAEIIEYLKSLPPGTRATAVDIAKVVSIDLSTDVKVLNMVKSNPKVETSFNSDGDAAFLYRPKFTILDRKDLVDTIERTAAGIALTDIQDCYSGLSNDVMEMIVGGDIIAIKNKEIRSLVLYPRNAPFLCELSGAITAQPGDINITTTMPLTNEIRRGEAIKVGDYWYRVSTAVKGVGATSNRPTSVVLEKEVASKHDFSQPFDQRTLPLDGDYEGTATFTGPAVRHGCTSDIQELWHSTANQLVKFQGRDHDLAQELVELNLLSTQFLQRPAHGKRQGEHNKNIAKKRAKRMRESQMNSGGYGVNEHLRGTTLARVLQETREQNFRADNKIT